MKWKLCRKISCICLEQDFNILRAKQPLLYEDWRRSCKDANGHPVHQQPSVVFLTTHQLYLIYSISGKDKTELGV